MAGKTYEGRGSTLEDAVRDAFNKIPQQGADIIRQARVVEWGYGGGGITGQHFFAVKVEEVAVST